MRTYHIKRAPVSVIVPCFNCAQTIERAIESVVNQNVKPHEVILVNDASQDDTASILAYLKRIHSSEEIIIIDRAINGGPATARNDGWRAATQPYVAFLDSDDIWYPDKLAVHYAWMDSHCDIALSGHRFETGELPFHSVPEKKEVRVKNITKWDLLLGNKFFTTTVLVRRNLPFRFENEKRYSEDYLLWSEVVLSGFRACLLDSYLACRFNAPYGEKGLSADLWPMEKGELHTYLQLQRKQLISRFVLLSLCLYSALKFIRRACYARLFYYWRKR